jgi:hypothetical protein
MTFCAAIVWSNEGVTDICLKSVSLQHSERDTASKTFFQADGTSVWGWESCPQFKERNASFVPSFKEKGPKAEFYETD